MHTTRCMHEASRLMGRAAFHSIYIFVADAVRWLAERGPVTVRSLEQTGGEP